MREPADSQIVFVVFYVFCVLIRSYSKFEFVCGSPQEEIPNKNNRRRTPSSVSSRDSLVDHTNFLFELSIIFLIFQLALSIVRRWSFGILQNLLLWNAFLRNSFGKFFLRMPFYKEFLLHEGRLLVRTSFRQVPSLRVFAKDWEKCVHWAPLTENHWIESNGRIA